MDHLDCDLAVTPDQKKLPTVCCLVSTITEERFMAIVLLCQSSRS